MAKAKLTRERFSELTLPHLGLLKRLALRYARSDARADDLVQETYLRAWKYRAGLDEGRNVKAWLCRILTNEVARDAGRNKIQEIGVDLADLDGAPEASRVYMDELPDEELRKALGEVPAEFAGALVLYAVEGFSYKEIADAQDVPIGTVMSRLHRARQMLRKALEPGVRAGLRVVK